MTDDYLKKDWSNYRNPDGTKIGEVPPTLSHLLTTWIPLAKKKQKTEILEVEYKDVKIISRPGHPWTYEYHNADFQNNKFLGILLFEWREDSKGKKYRNCSHPFVFLVEDDFKAIYKNARWGCPGSYDDQSIIVYKHKEDKYLNWTKDMIGTFSGGIESKYETAECRKKAAKLKADYEKYKKTNSEATWQEFVCKDAIKDFDNSSVESYVAHLKKKHDEFGIPKKGKVDPAASQPKKDEGDAS